MNPDERSWPQHSDRSTDPLTLPAEAQGDPEASADQGPRVEPPTSQSSRFGESIRSWLLVLFVIATSGLGFLITSGIVMVAALVVVLGSFDLTVLRNPESMSQVVGSRIGFPMLVVIPQLALIVMPLTLACLSRRSLRESLGLVRGHWPLWAWLAAALAVPLVGMVSGVICGLFLEESDQLKKMSEIFRELGQGGFLLPLALMIGLTPAICEEILFRGFVQTRLTRTVGPLLAILFASAVFALFHWDPVHVLAVFPIGLFLGWVSWRSGSLFPAMMGHFMNNVTSVAAVVLGPDGEAEALSLPSAMFVVLILAAGAIGMVAVLVASVIAPPPSTAREGFG